MSGAEGDALLDEPVGEIGGEEKGIGSGGFTSFFIDFHGGDHLGVHLEGEREGVDGIEERFFVLL